MNTPKRIGIGIGLLLLGAGCSGGSDPGGTNKGEALADVLAVADGCVVGSSLKVGGDTWNAVDPERAAEFMRLARTARGGSGR